MTGNIEDIRARLWAKAAEGEETAEIYRREARAVFEQDGMMAAGLLLDAAYANDHDDAAQETILRDLELACQLAPESVWGLESTHRLLLKLGLWRKAIPCLEREYELVEDLDYRLAVCLTLTDLYWIVAEDLGLAMTWVDRALGIDAHCVAALYAGLWISLSKGTDAALLARAEGFASTLAQVLGAPSERAVLYDLAGTIQMAHGDEARACESLALATQADRANPYVWLKFAWLCEKFARIPEAAQAYAQVAQIVEDSELSGAFFHRAAVLYGFVGQHERESFYYSECLKRVNDKYGVARWAVEAFLDVGNAQRAVELETQMVEMADDEETRAAHRMVLADLRLDAFRDADEAVAMLEQIPTPMAHARLAAMYDARHDAGNLARILQVMASEDAWGAPCLTWLAGVALGESGAREEAIRTFSAMQGRLGLYQLDRAYDDTCEGAAHARMLESWANSTHDAPTRAALTSQLVTLLSERMHAPEIAIQYLRSVHSTEISRDLAWRRHHLLASLGQYDDTVASLLEMSTDTTDEDEALMWRMEAALCLDRNLEDTDRAIELLMAIHRDAPSYVPAIVLTHHIALRDRRFELLMTSNAWRDEFQMSAARRAETALENAWACLQLKDDKTALLEFEKARKLQPLPLYALRMYVALLKRLQKWKELVDLVQEHLDRAVVKHDAQHDASREDVEPAQDGARPSRDEGLELLALHGFALDVQTYGLHHLAGTLHARLKYFERRPTMMTFVSTSIEKLTVDPADTVMDTLQRMRGALGAVSEEADALFDWMAAAIVRAAQREEQAQTIALWLRRSLPLPYGVCLRAEVLRTLRELPHEDAVSWLERYSQQTSDKWMNHALCREAALRSIWIDSDVDAARHVLSDSLIREDSDRRTLWMLEHFSSVSEDWQALGYFRERLAQLDISSPRARLQTLKTALAPYLDDDQTAHAVRVARECVKLDAHALPALVTLAAVAEESQDTYSLACIADRLSEASAAPENRVSYGLWAAQLWANTLHKTEQAIASLSRLLSHDPACMPAIQMSEQLLPPLDRYEPLARIYAHAIAAMPEGPRQLEILRKQAALQAHQLHDIPAATLTLARLIAQAPADLDALAMQADLLIEQTRWSEAVETIEQLSAHLDDPERKRAAFLKHADILIHQLEQPDRARRILRKLLVQSPHDMAALKLLYDIACAERNWSDAKATLEEICADTQHPDEVRRARCAFTRIAREAGWTHDMRTLYERQAIDAVIDSRNDFDALIEDYRTHHELQRLIDVTRRELSQQGNAERIAQYRGCVAALLVANRQHREALAFLSDVIHESQNTDWAYLARAQALASAGQIDSAIGEFRRTLRKNIALNDAFPPFIDVLKQTGDPISLAAVTALYEKRSHTDSGQRWMRCSKGTPRGFFDVELIPIPRAFADAQRYLRLMTPSAFELFGDTLPADPLPDDHWALARVRRLFGQNLDVRRIYTTTSMKTLRARAKLDAPGALIFDAELIDENNPIPFDFWASFAMHQAVTGGCLIDALDDTTVEALFLALCQPKPESALAQSIKKQLFRALPRADRKLFKDGVPFLVPSWPDFRLALQTRAACLAAVFCASPACALACRPDDQGLETFLISENYPRFVRMFWTQEENSIDL